MHESELARIRALDFPGLSRFVDGRIRGNVIPPQSVYDLGGKGGNPNTHELLEALVRVEEVPLRNNVIDAVMVSYLSIWDQAFFAKEEDQRKEVVENLHRGAAVVARASSKEFYPAIQNIFEGAVSVCEEDPTDWNQVLLGEAAKVFMYVSEDDPTDGQTRKELLTKGLRIATEGAGYIWQSLLRTDIGEKEMNGLYEDMVRRQEAGGLDMNVSYFKKLMDRRFATPENS